MLNEDGTYLRPCGCLWLGPIPLEVCEDHSKLVNFRCYFVEFRHRRLNRCTYPNLHDGDHRFNDLAD